MDTLERIRLLLKDVGKNQTDLTDALGLNKQAFTDWNAQRSESYKKYINEIAEFFDVSIDYLLGKTDIKKPPLNLLHTAVLTAIRY